MPRSRLFAVLLVAPLLSSCGSSSSAPEVYFGLEFEAEEGALDITRLPFPNAALFDEQGELRVTTTSLPFADNANSEVMATISAAFEDLDCFGPVGGVIFPVLGLEDIPDLSAGLLEGLGHLVDLDTGEEIPSQAYYRKREHLLHLRAKPGIALRQGGHYLAYLQGSAKLDNGASIEASPNLSMLLASESPGDEGLAAVHLAYEPLRAYVADKDLDTKSLLAATSYRTCEYNFQYEAIAQEVQSAPAPTIQIDTIYRAGAELDGFLGTPLAGERATGFGLEGGVAHADLAAVFLGHFKGPNYLSSTPNALGRFEANADGVLEPKGEQDVSFLISLPAGLASYSEVPVLIFQHGMGANRGRALSLANRMAQAGLAVVAIDLPFHGHRVPGFADQEHNFSDLPGPDGIPEDAGVVPLTLMFDIIGSEDVPGLDPGAISDNFRQSVVDLFVLERAILASDWSAIATSDALFADFSFRNDALAFSSESFGGLVGVPFVALSQRVGAAWLSVAGGGLTEDLVENSPTYGGLFMPIVAGTFGLSPNQLDLSNAPPHTHWALQMFSMLIGAGDPTSYVQTLRESNVHVVMSSAYNDEAMPNQSSEALAGQLGLDWLPVQGGPEAPAYVEASLLSPTTSPVMGNQQGRDGAVTRVYFEAEPATHPMLTVAFDERDYDYGFPPFVPLESPVAVANPVEELQTMLARFASSYFDSQIAEVVDAF